ncbi:MAG: methyltransferase domain-containing protein [Frankiales bacterium]|nr:methyltransferase domain-containing protein [Frankiales bacterium]
MTTSSRPTRWETETASGHSERFLAHFRALARDGADLGGEARLLDAIVAPGSRILDAGCGSGRVGAVLHARGHRVVGVDADPVLVEGARADHPGPRWLVADLATLDLPALGVADPFDAAVLAGNVMVYVAPGSEGEVLARVAAHVVADGVVVVGFATDRGYGVDSLSRDADAAGLDVEHRFATWDLRPWQIGSDFAVVVLRRRTVGG